MSKIKFKVYGTVYIEKVVSVEDKIDSGEKAVAQVQKEIYDKLNPAIWTKKFNLKGRQNEN